MIRSSKLSIKFANNNKQETVSMFIDEYNRVCQKFIEVLWDEEKIPSLLPKNITSQIETWLSARMLQCAGKQSAAIIKGTKQKQRQREFIYQKLLKEGKLKNARKLKAIIDRTKISKPRIEIKPELDARFVKNDFTSNTSFDFWTKLASIGNKINLSIPIKKSKHFNKLFKMGSIKTGIRLSKKDITFMFDIPDKRVKEEGATIGLDVGIKNVFTLSNGITNKSDKHGWNLSKIQNKLTKRKRGSKNFHKAQEHRKNYINWSLKQINFNNTKELKIENIKNIRTGKRCSNFLNRWTYREIFGKLEYLCEENGVRITRINPTYTSQRCNKCGWVCKNNRNGKLFKCGKCGYIADADLNAAINISLNLPSIDRKKRLSKANKKGFYWLEIGKENIVPSTQKVKM